MKPRRTLIVGSGDDAHLVYRKLTAHPEYGLEVVGFLDGDVGAAASRTACSAARTRSRASSTSTTSTACCSPRRWARHEETLDLVRTVRRPNVQVSIVPRYFEIFTSHAILDDVEGMPVVTLPPMRLGRSAQLLKRSMDVARRGDSPCSCSRRVLGAVALAIRLDSPGPALYWQPRRGRLGSTFRIVKFRTMFTGAEQRRERGPAHERGRRAAVQDQGQGSARDADRLLPATHEPRRASRSSGTSSRAR